ncbi:hypothetical protein B0H14DRAFT_3507815 [Mycena olivaceomarginata]|nr:hypothetical protein B0H14DRAFT_3507815 [Mycena olivaceomarginata]
MPPWTDIKPNQAVDGFAFRDDVTGVWLPVAAGASNCCALRDATVCLRDAMCIDEWMRSSRCADVHTAVESSLPGNASSPFSSRALFHSAARTPQFSPRLAASARLSIPATTWTWCIPTNTTSQLAMLAATWDCHDKVCKQRPRSAAQLWGNSHTRISTARGLRSAAHERVGSTRAFLVRGWGWEHTGSERKSRTGARARVQRQLSTRAKAQRRPCSTSGWFAKHWRHDSTLTGAPKTTDTSTTLSFLGRPHSSSPRPPARGPQRTRVSFGSAVLRGGGEVRQRTTQARTRWEREECVRAHKPRAPVMAGAHHLDLIRPAGYAGLPRSCCTTTTPVVRSIAIATSQLALPWAPGTSLAAHRALLLHSVQHSSPGSYVGFRVGVGPFPRGLDAPPPDPSAVCFPLRLYVGSSPAGSPPQSPSFLGTRLLRSLPRPSLPAAASRFGLVLAETTTRPRHWAIDFPLGNSDPALLLVPLLLDAAGRCSWCGVIGGEGERGEEQSTQGGVVRRSKEHVQAEVGEARKRGGKAAKRVPIRMESEAMSSDAGGGILLLQARGASTQALSPPAASCWERRGRMIASDEGTQMHEDERSAVSWVMEMETPSLSPLPPINLASAAHASRCTS